MSVNKLPSGKLRKLIQFCKELTQMLQATSKDGMPDGADSFIPIVNYSLL